MLSPATAEVPTAAPLVKKRFFKKSLFGFTLQVGSSFGGTVLFQTEIFILPINHGLTLCR